jgi:hypothetical protein
VYGRGQDPTEVVEEGLLVKIPLSSLVRVWRSRYSVRTWLAVHTVAEDCFAAAQDDRVMVDISGIW